MNSQKTPTGIYLTIGFFLAFSGYYVILMLVSNLASLSVSRFFTIPVRLLIMMAFYILYCKNRTSPTSFAGQAFISFSFLYILRVLLEALDGLSSLYMSETEFALYFLSFVFFPFYFIQKICFSDWEYNRIFFSIMIGCLVLSVLTYIFYGQLLGSVGRISQEIGKDENYISPLALSYCSALGIGVGAAYLLTNKVGKKQTLYITIIILLCFIPFFLGASRGSVLALIVPFSMFLLFSKGLGEKLKIGFGIVVLAISVLFATEFFGTSVFDRLFATNEAIEQGGSSAIRVVMWKDALNQFYENPVFGNSLESKSVKHHPHNIVVEVLISTGLIGFIPFFIFLVLTLKKAIYIIREHPSYLWLSVIFFQGFAQNMFTGAIWGASWFVLGAALVLGFKSKYTI